MSTLSLCMMVKNEAGTLHRALTSAVDYVDEVCILDTGSTDGQTPRIARRFAHKYHQCLMEPFHFADARNMSISMATSDYVLILDGDEYLEASDAWRDLRETLRRERPGSVTVTLCNRLAGGTMHERLPQRRVFRREGLHYIGRVHHTLEGDPAAPITVQATLHHTGFDLSDEERTAKYLPRVAMNRQAAKESRSNPKRYAYYRYKLGEALMMTGQYAEARSVFRWCWNSPHVGRTLDCGSYYVKSMLRAFTHEGKRLRRAEAIAVANELALMAGKRGEAVPLFHASWMLMLCEQEVSGLRLMSFAHALAMNPPQHARQTIDEALIRQSLSELYDQMGMPATGAAIREAEPLRAAAIITEFAEAFVANPSQLKQEAA